MKVKVEPTGCCERKGLVQIRFCFYLEPSDARYNERHIHVPIRPPEGYQGEVDAEGSAVDIKDYNEWRKGWPKIWQNTPFHNHFIYIDPGVTDEEIMDIGEELLKEVYADWSSNKTPNPKNKRVVLPDRTNSRIEACKTKVQHLKGTLLERKV